MFVYHTNNTKLNLGSLQFYGRHGGYQFLRGFSTHCWHVTCSQTVCFGVCLSLVIAAIHLNLGS